MTPERWQQIKSTLADAMAMSPVDRAAYLERIGAADPELRLEVFSLLAADEEAGSRFLHTPAPDLLGGGRAVQGFVGRRLGPYQLVAEIGRGGMGEVYRARRVDQEYQQEVAIKLVRAGRDPEFVGSRLRTERQILASFKHANIARLLDGGTTQEGIPYLVMELIEGKPILDYCDEQRLDTTARLKLFMLVCAAVQYAHQRMVIHRDLKPSNILVTADGVPKLLDFGIAKILEPGFIPSAPDLTINAFRILTPQYASPEQFKGEPVTAVSDVYSLGVILYELLTGLKPYVVRGERLTHEFAKAVFDREPRRPSTIVWPRSVAARSDAVARSQRDAVSVVREGSPEKLSRRLRGDLDNIVLMALRKEPERRYRSADQLAEDIGRHLQHMPVIARGNTLGYRVTTFVRRHTAAVVTAGLVAVALVGGIVITTREAHVAEAQQRIAEAQRARAERRFNDVRKLANALIFDIHDSIRDLAGASDSRRLLIQTSMQYLESLAQEATGDAALQRELAAAFLRLGDLQGRAFEANESDYAGAQKSYRRSFALLQSSLALEPHNLDARRDLVVNSGKLSDLLWNMGDSDGALFFSNQTVLNSKLLAQMEPANPKYPILVAQAEGDYAHKVYQIRGDRATALPLMKRSIATFEAARTHNPGDPRIERTLALMYSRMSDPLRDEHDYSEALHAAGQQRELLEPMVEQAPRNADLAHLLGFSYYDTAQILIDSGRFAAAASDEQTALESFRALAATDPGVEEYRVDIALALNGIASIRLGQQHAREAIAPLREAAQQLGGSPHEPNTSKDFRYAQGQTSLLLGQAYMALASDGRRSPAQQMQDRRSACDQYRRALTAFQELTTRKFEAAQTAREISEKLQQCDRAPGAQESRTASTR